MLKFLSAIFLFPGTLLINAIGISNFARGQHRHVVHPHVARVLQMDRPMRAVLRCKALQRNATCIVEVHQPRPARTCVVIVCR